jgi:hypothetical protein
MRIWGDKSERSAALSGAETEPTLTGDGNIAGSSRDSIESMRENDERYRAQKRFHTEVAEVIDRLASPSPLARMVGARSVARVATLRPPGAGSARNTEGCPAFAPLAQAVALALAHEEQTNARESLREAVDALLEWGREGEQTLLYVLVEALADANRACVRLFAESLGECLPADGTLPASLMALFPVPTSHLSARAIAERLTAMPEFAQARLCRDAALQQAGQGGANVSVSALLRFGARGQSLTALRDTLATALRALENPPVSVAASGPALYEWRRNGKRLYLFGAFLAGAKLGGAALHGATLAKSYLHNAELENTVLLGADLADAGLTETVLYNAVVGSPANTTEEAKTLPPTDLRRANWWNAAPASWRGTPGQALKGWLQNRYPAPTESPIRDLSPLCPPLSVPTFSVPVATAPPPVPVLPAPEVPVVPVMPVVPTSALSFETNETNFDEEDYDEDDDAYSDEEEEEDDAEENQAVTVPASPTPAIALPALPPLPAPRMVAGAAHAPSAGGTAAAKLAELKNRRAKAEQSKVPGVRPLHEEPLPSERREFVIPKKSAHDKPNQPQRKNQVTLRDKALPKDGDVFAESDFLGVTDLMSDAAPITATGTVQVRRSGLPDDTSVTDDDLRGVTNLMDE